MVNAEHLINRFEALLDRIESTLSADTGHAQEWTKLAYRWRRPNTIKPVSHPHLIGLDDLFNIERQKDLLVQNTRQFVTGAPANNALLWGSRGTGKSTLIKAMLTEFSEQNLRLIEVDKQDLIDLPDIADALYDRPERFIIFTDDMSFEASDPSYKALKAMLDGSICAAPENMLIYATSNRRHLMPEFMQENLQTHHIDGELHYGETVEEKISLSERFGLWISFYPFTQEQYLDTVTHWLKRLGVNQEDVAAARAEALRWALSRGSRSGRVAHQFARDLAGRMSLASPEAT
jgi:predicted AAA+ superfamily ATPase